MVVTLRIFFHPQGSRSSVTNRLGQLLSRVRHSFRHVRGGFQRSFHLGQRRNHVITESGQRRLAHSVGRFQGTFSQKVASFGTLRHRGFTGLSRRRHLLITGARGQLRRVHLAMSRGLRGALGSQVNRSFQLIARRLRDMRGKLKRVRALTRSMNNLGHILDGIGAHNGVKRVRLDVLLRRVLTPRRCRTGIRAHGKSSTIIRFTIGLPKHSSIHRFICLPVSTGFPGSICRRLLSTCSRTSARTVRTTKGLLRAAVGGVTGSVSSGCLTPPTAASFNVVFLPFRKVCTRIMHHSSLLRRLRHGCGIIIANPAALTTVLGDLRVKFHALTVRGRSNRM